MFHHKKHGKFGCEEMVFIFGEIWCVLTWRCWICWMFCHRFDLFVWYTCYVLPNPKEKPNNGVRRGGKERAMVGKWL
jgi:hypothetical protein